MSGERGRPRNFDSDVVLDKALEVFWRNGFHNASLTELTTAMGMSKPSLYAAFGDKEALYVTVLERYMTQQIANHAALLDADADARRALDGFLRAMARMFADPAAPGGCFIVNGIADHGATATPQPVEQALRKALQANEARLCRHIEQAQRSGQLDASLGAKDLAAFFISLLAGLAVLAKSGAKPSKLNGAIDIAMTMWPAAKARR